MSKRDEILKLADGTLTPREIAERTGASVNYVYRIAPGLCARQSGSGRKRDEVLRASIARLLAMGVSPYAASRRLGCSKTTAYAVSRAASRVAAREAG